MRNGSILCVIFISWGLPSFCLGQDAIPRPDPCHEYRENLPFYSITEINRATLSEGQYNTEGYVILASTCPPCPEGAVCETCLIDHLFVSETDEKSTLAGSKMRRVDLILFADDLAQFKVGEKYKFSIEIPKAYNFDATYMTGYSNRVRVVGHEHIPLN